MAKRKRTNNDLQNTTQKTKKNLATRTLQNPVVKSGPPGRVISSYSTSGTRRVAHVKTPMASYE